MYKKDRINKTNINGVNALKKEVWIKTAFIALFPLIAVLLIIIVTAASGTKNFVGKAIKFHIDYGDTYQDIVPLKKDGEWFVFLPGDVAADKVTLTLKGYKRIELDETTIENGDDLSGFTDGTYEIKAGKRRSKITIRQGSAIPALYINVSKKDLKKVEEGKKDGANAKVDLYNEKGGREYSTFDRSGLLGLLGDPKEDSEKKSYSLSLIDGPGLFGTEGSVRWTLNSNADDETNLRNAFVYEVASLLGIKNMPETHMADLYANGKYLGLYRLTGVSDNLYEEENVIFGRNTKKSRIFKDTVYTTVGGSDFELFGSVENETVKNEWKARVQKIENAIHSDTTEYVDFIDYKKWSQNILMNEVFGNAEREETGFCWSRETDKVYPLFSNDFELGFGNEKKASGLNSPYTYLANADDWTIGLMNIEGFGNYVRSYYLDEFKPIVDGYRKESFKRLRNRISRSAENDRLLWEDLRTGSFESVEEAEKEFDGFLDVKMDVLERILVNGDDYHSIEFDVSKVSKAGTIKGAIAFSGEKLCAFPNEKVIRCRKFGGWYNEETGEKIDEDTVIYEDMRIVGRDGESKLEKLLGNKALMWITVAVTILAAVYFLCFTGFGERLLGFIKKSISCFRKE